MNSRPTLLLCPIFTSLFVTACAIAPPRSAENFAAISASEVMGQPPTLAAAPAAPTPATEYSVDNPNYASCTGCDDSISPAKRGLLSVAITTNNTDVLRALLESVQAPFSYSDRRALDDAFLEEMKKESRCDNDRLEALIARGATIRTSTLGIYAGDVVFCNAGLLPGVIGYHLQASRQDSAEYFAVLLTLAQGIEKARFELIETLQVLNGREQSELQDPDGFNHFVRQYANLAVSSREILAMAKAFEEIGVGDLAHPLVFRLNARYHYFKYMNQSVLRARDNNHPHDRRTSVYNKLAAALKKAFDGARSRYEQSPTPKPASTSGPTEVAGTSDATNRS